MFCLYRPVAAGHFGPSSSGGLGALPLGALRLGALALETFFLRISFSDLKGDVSSCVGRLKIVLFACSEKGGCSQYRTSPLCTSCIYRLLACMAVLFQESSTLLYCLCCFTFSFQMRSHSVATNIGKKFFTLLSACFPANNKLHKIINKNTIKLSYSCMSNIKQNIVNHNKTILSKEKIKEEQIKLCNCRNRTLCPLQGNCLKKRSRLPGHRHTDQHNEGRHLYRNNRERVENTI